MRIESLRELRKHKFGLRSGVEWGRCSGCSRIEDAREDPKSELRKIESGLSVKDKVVLSGLLVVSKLTGLNTVKTLSWQPAACLAGARSLSSFHSSLSWRRSSLQPYSLLSLSLFESNNERRPTCCIWQSRLASRHISLSRSESVEHSHRTSHFAIPLYTTHPRVETLPTFALIVCIIGQDRKRDRQADAWEQMDAAQ